MIYIGARGEVGMLHHACSLVRWYSVYGFMTLSATLSCVLDRHDVCAFVLVAIMQAGLPLSSVSVGEYMYVISASRNGGLSMNFSIVNDNWKLVLYYLLLHDWGKLLSRSAMQ